MNDAVEKVIADLSNQNRANPQDLDRALAGFLRDVLRRKDDPHTDVARTFNISWGIESMDVYRPWQIKHYIWNRKALNK